MTCLSFPFFSCERTILNLIVVRSVRRSALKSQNIFKTRKKHSISNKRTSEQISLFHKPVNYSNRHNSITKNSTDTESFIPAASFEVVTDIDEAGAAVVGVGI